MAEHPTRGASEMADAALSTQQVAQVQGMLKAAAATPPPPDWTDGLDAVGDFIAKALWPLVLVLLLWRLFPVVLGILRDRGFSVEVGGVKVSVQQATKEIGEFVEDLQKQVSELRRHVGLQEPGVAAAVAEGQLRAAGTASLPPRILWVDDHPANNAWLIAQLKKGGVQVVESNSTEDALAILDSSKPFHAIISDMGRREKGRYDGKAGLSLLTRLRDEKRDEPYMIYTTQKYVERTRAEVKTRNAQATASPVELLEWVRAQLPPGSDL